MSEDTSTPVPDSDSTLTPEPEHAPLTADQVVETLNSALVELKETGDYLSYATLIEIQLQSKQDQFDTESKDIVLSGLFEILKANPDVVYEIGWDLPSLLLDYLFSKWDLKYGLKNNAGLLAILKIFGVLSAEGNPKEIFLRSCELLTSLKFEEIELQNETEYWSAEFPYKLAGHSLIELCNAALGRVKTRYPSRFLSQAIISILNFLTNNFEYVLDTRIFLFRRVYVFIRQYGGIPLPDDVSKIDPAELRETIEDEEYLQRKLITSFLTHFISVTIPYETMNWVYEYYSKELHNPNSKFRLPGVTDPDTTAQNNEEDGWDMLLFRNSQLAVSMDIDLEEMFLQQIRDAKLLFANLDHSKSLDVLNDEVYTLVINDFNKKSKPQREIPISEMGILFLFTQFVNMDSYYQRPVDPHVVPIDVEGMIKFTVRSLIPTLLDPSLSNKSLIDAVLFWAWYTVKHDSQFATALPKLDPVFVNIFLQSLISLSAVNPNSAVRIIIFTLVTRVLTLADETLSYKFIAESITTCPYDNAKAALIGILKDLLIRPRLAQLTQSLEKINLNADDDDDDSAAAAAAPPPPALPPREIPTYISLTAERKAQLLAMLNDQIDSFFNGTDTDKTTNNSKVTSPAQGKIEMSIVLSFINLLIAIKPKLTRSEIDQVVSKTEKAVAGYKSKHGKEERDEDALNIDFLLVATDALNK